MTSSSGPTANISDLPQEVVDIVVDYMAETAENRRATLHVCNAVSRFFHARAQQHLFGAIQIVVDDGTSQRAENLRQILEANPTLVGRIHSFKIVINKSKSLVELLRPPKIGRVPSWLRRVVWDVGVELGISKEHFLWLLQTISSVQVVNFSLVAAEGTYLDWLALSDYSQSLFLSIRSSGRLKGLELANIYNLTSRMVIGHQEGVGLPVQDSLQIQDLVVRCCHLKTSSTIVFDIPSMIVPFRYLQALEIAESRDNANFFVDLQSTLDTVSPTSQPFQFPSLTSLTVSLTSNIEELESAMAIMKNCKKTITYLKLRVKASYVPLLLTVAFTMPRMPALRELWFSANVRSAADVQSVLWHIAQILRSPTAPSAIETIGLDLVVELGSKREVQAVFGWEDLDKALVDRAFPELWKVVIMLNLPQYKHDQWSKVVDAENILPATTSCGRIVVEVRDITRGPFN